MWTDLSVIEVSQLTSRQEQRFACGMWKGFPGREAPEMDQMLHADDGTTQTGYSKVQVTSARCWQGGRTLAS